LLVQLAKVLQLWDFNLVVVGDKVHQVTFSLVSNESYSEAISTIPASSSNSMLEVSVVRLFVTMGLLDRHIILDNQIHFRHVDASG
jgi:hypothetical protein